MIPTVGFNMKKVTKGNVTIKLWDIGGQPRFRSMWERYCRGVNAIVYAFLACFLPLSYRISRPDYCWHCSFSSKRQTPQTIIPCSYVVDGADKEKFEQSRKELHELIVKPQLAGIPLLVLGNKNDLPECVSLEELVKIMSGLQSLSRIELVHLNHSFVHLRKIDRISGSWSASKIVTWWRTQSRPKIM